MLALIHTIYIFFLLENFLSISSFSLLTIYTYNYTQLNNIKIFMAKSKLPHIQFFLPLKLQAALSNFFHQPNPHSKSINFLINQTSPRPTKICIFPPTTITYTYLTIPTICFYSYYSNIYARYQ